MVTVVRRELAALQPRCLLTMGYCRGGYAAVRCGVALRAHKVLAFAPTCFLRPAQRRELRLPAMYFDEHLASLAAGSNGSPLASLSEALCAEEAGSCAAWRPAEQWRRECAAVRREVDTITIELHTGGMRDRTMCPPLIHCVLCLISSDMHLYDLPVRSSSSPPA